MSCQATVFLTHTQFWSSMTAHGHFPWPALEEFQHKHSDSLCISRRCVCESFYLLWGIKCVDRSPKAFWVWSRHDKTHSPWGETQLRCLRVYVCLYSVNCIHLYTCLKWKPRGKAILFYLFYTQIMRMRNMRIAAFIKKEKFIAACGLIKLQWWSAGGRGCELFSFFLSLAHSNGPLCLYLCCQVY